jgi:hypothetical protein
MFAKRQRTLRGMFGAKESNVRPPSSPTKSEKKQSLSAVEISRNAWKDAWYDLFYWIEFDSITGRAFCKVCKTKGARSVFANQGFINIKVSAFHDHEQSKEHKRLAWAKQKGKKVMEKAIAVANQTCDEAMLALFKVAYFIVKETLPFSKFLKLCKLLVDLKAYITKDLYYDDKSCADLIFCASSVIQKKVLERVKDSKYYGIMINESTNISVIGHLVVFASFIESGLPSCAFLGLLYIIDGKKDSGLIFNTLLSSMKEWDLDFDKCLGFGSDGASTMTGKNKGVATRFKLEVNPFLLAIHCVAHRTQLVALDGAKLNGCAFMSNEVDKLLNGLASYFHKSSKRKAALQALQAELFDSKKSLRRFHKVRWLSRWQVVTTLCNSLESVLSHLRDMPPSKDDGQAPNLFEKLRSFKVIYVLHFLVDLLYSLSLLSRVFQYKNVDVSIIGSLVKTEILQVRMLFIEESTNLNHSTFNEDSGYHVLPEFGPPGGYMKKLATQIR